MYSQISLGMLLLKFKDLSEQNAICTFTSQYKLKVVPSSWLYGQPTLAKNKLNFSWRKKKMFIYIYVCVYVNDFFFFNLEF